MTNLSKFLQSIRAIDVSVWSKTVKLAIELQTGVMNTAISYWCKCLPKETG